MERRYELPSHNYFAREALPQMYTEVRQSLADQLANVTILTSDLVKQDVRAVHDSSPPRALERVSVQLQSARMPPNLSDYSAKCSASKTHCSLPPQNVEGSTRKNITVWTKKVCLLSDLPL